MAGYVILIVFAIVAVAVVIHVRRTPPLPSHVRSLRPGWVCPHKTMSSMTNGRPDLAPLACQGR